MIRFLLLAAALLLAGCSDGGKAPEEDTFGKETRASATTGVIRGVVVDAAINPIEGATVSVRNTDHQALSDALGQFAFQGLEPGTYFIQATKPGYTSVQSSAEVVAGVDNPPIVRISLVAVAGAEPFVEPLFQKGHLTCGAAVFATSVGCTTIGTVASLIGDQSIFPVDYERVPNWIQGELVWKSTQALSGAFIWEIVQSEYPGTPQPHIGYRETKHSPALAYLDNATTGAYAEWILDKGIDFRFFGGPHELCGGIYGFGCGVTLEQSTEVFIHNFYNFTPDEGWRFTEHGEHPLPQ